MTDLITLTADDLRGCDPIESCKFCYVADGIIHVWWTGGHYTAVSSKHTIQCHPHDYIRAWLGPSMSRFPWANAAKKYDGGIALYDFCDDGRFILAHCPPALASAMGSDVWRKTETGWEVVK